MENCNKNMAQTREEIIALLREYGITPTDQRVRIGQVLFDRLQHIAAEEVLTRVNQSCGNVSKATVYNTLGLFARKGLLREVVVDPCKLFYDTNLNPHHHFYHTDNGRLEDVNAHKVHITQLPELPEGTNIEGVDVIIRVQAAEQP